VNGVDPLSRETSECGKVRISREPLGFGPPHLAGRGCIALDSFAADDPAHRGITSQTVGVINIFISGKPTEHRLAQDADVLVVSAFVGILETAPAADFVYKDRRELGSTVLHVEDQLLERASAVEPQTALTLVGISANDFETTSLGVLADGIALAFC